DPEEFVPAPEQLRERLRRGGGFRLREPIAEEIELPFETGCFLGATGEQLRVVLEGERTQPLFEDLDLAAVGKLPGARLDPIVEARPLPFGLAAGALLLEESLPGDFVERAEPRDQLSM